MNIELESFLNLSGTSTDSFVGRELIPETVLYDYDGPLTFTLTFNDTLYLASVISYPYYVLVPKTEEEIVSLACCYTPLYDALTDRKQAFIVHLDDEMMIQKTWTINPNEIPEDFLPSQSVTLGTEGRQITHVSNCLLCKHVSDLELSNLELKKLTSGVVFYCTLPTDKDCVNLLYSDSDINHFE